MPTPPEKLTSLFSCPTHRSGLYTACSGLESVTGPFAYWHLRFLRREILPHSIRDKVKTT